MFHISSSYFQEYHDFLLQDLRLYYNMNKQNYGLLVIHIYQKIFLIHIEDS